MLNTILNTILTKLLDFTVSLRLVLCTIFFVLVSVIVYQSNKLFNLKEQLTLAEYRLSSVQSIYTDEITKAKEIINKQNTTIKQLAIDTSYYEKRIKQKENELKQNFSSKRDIVIENVSKNNSAENQLDVITQILKDFSNENN